MATGIYNKGVRSAGRGHTISQLRALRESNYHNPDTGTELNAEEADHHLNVMQQNQADKHSARLINSLLKQGIRSRGRPMIAGNDVVFRMIHGHRVPFRRKADPFL